MTKLTTNSEDNLRWRSSTLFVFFSTYVISSDGMIVSIAWKTSTDSITGEIKENSFSCIYLSGYSFNP